jgi:peptidoglycan/xylan/chitin deacetylase (PgdA/CDA1 family)
MTSRLLSNRSSDVVFLCYHSVAVGGPPFLSIAPELFERQLAMLRRLGFRSGALADAASLAQGRKPTSKLAFLTFDDGYVDNYEIARPLLEAYGFQALIFVLPPFVDTGAPLLWPRVERHVRDHPEIMRSMTWTMVDEMRAAGHEFGSHTLSHPQLPHVDDDSLRRELLDSRSQLVERLGACDAVAYPFGEWTPRVAGAAASVGYVTGFSLPHDSQWGADRLTLPRISVDHRDDERRFRLKLTPAYRAFLLSPLKSLARKVLRRSAAHETAA